MKKAILIVLIFCLMGCSHYKTYTTTRYQLDLGMQVYSLEHVDVKKLLETEIAYPLLKNGESIDLSIEQRFSYKTPEGETKYRKVKIIYHLQNRDDCIELMLFDIWWYGEDGRETFSQ